MLLLWQRPPVGPDCIPVGAGAGGTAGCCRSLQWGRWLMVVVERSACTRGVLPVGELLWVLADVVPPGVAVGVCVGLRNAQNGW